MDAVVAPVDHKKDAAPDAVNAAEDPEQMLPGPEIETTGLGLTLIKALLDPEQPAVVPVTE
jgi:hypothetical protein